jgi:hypothetical protein
MIRRLTLALALLVGVAVAAPTSAQAGYVFDIDDFAGIGFQYRTVCLDMRTPSGFRVLEREVAAEFDTRTDLIVFREYGPTACDNPATNPPGQQVIVEVGAYGKTGWVGLTTTLKRRYGDDGTDDGAYFWLVRRIQLNLSYTNNYGGWDHILTHEMAHAVSLKHRLDTCASVVTQRSGCTYWYRYLTATDLYMLKVRYAGRAK